MSAMLTIDNQQLKESLLNKPPVSQYETSISPIIGCRFHHSSANWQLGSKLVYLLLMMFMGNKTRLAHRILFPLEVTVAAVLAGWRMTGHWGHNWRLFTPLRYYHPHNAHLSRAVLLSKPLVRHLVILNITHWEDGRKRKV